MKIGAAAYPMTWLADWDAYEAKLTSWIAEAAGEGASLLVFPEYGAMELATLGGAEVCADLARATRQVSDLMGDVNQLHRDLCARHGVHVLGASGPLLQPDGTTVNRAHLHTPTGQTGFQDKILMTLWEKDPWQVTGGTALKVFDTALGTLAVNICYDSEFPLQARAQRAAEVLLVPSATDKLEGYWRVRIGAMARALENQCVVAMSSIVGHFPELDAVDVSVGMGGIFGPPDEGFPATGVLAEGALNQPGWTYAEVDLETVRRVRRSGNVRTLADWPEQAGEDSVECCELR